MRTLRAVYAVAVRGRSKMFNKTPKVVAREQEPAKRAQNFEEVCYGYDLREAQKEAKRCLSCKNPRCTKACPVGVKIPQFIEQIVKGDIIKAGEIIAQDNALPAICGRVCPQESQCEGDCILGIKGESVAIGKLERFVADTNMQMGKNLAQIKEKNDIKIAIIGSGPSGLTCAGELAKLGYKVRIYEALHKPGGVLQYGIPEFRLPKEKVVQKEIQAILDLGVEIDTNVLVGRTITIDELIEKEDYKAIFIASGAGLPRFMNIKGEMAKGVFSANEFLTRANLMRAYDDSYDTPIFIGKHTVTVGGGNVAMDCARTALRLGSASTIVYRRTEKEMPARIEEIHHAKEESVDIKTLTNPVEILTDDKGWVRGIRCVQMKLEDEDSSGRRKPIQIKGSEFEIKCDSVIMALGTSPNPLIQETTPDLQSDKKGCLVIDEDTGMTTMESVYAGGDVVTGAATVILAMGAGKKAAKNIDAYLKAKSN